MQAAKPLRSPLRWAGGKSRLRKHILPLMPPHRKYVEPFAGAAWVLMGKAASPEEVVNDIDPDVANFWTTLRDSCEDLIDSFDLDLVSRSEFQRLAELDPSALDPAERAHRFTYLLMAGWGGESHYPRFTISLNDQGHGNRLAGFLQNVRQRLQPVSLRIRDVEVENLDWKDCINRHDDPDTLFYLDPPYPRNGVNYRHNMDDPREHDRLAERLAASTSRWMLSSYDDADTRRRYRNFHTTPINSKSGMPDAGNGRHTNRELLVMNFSPNRLL